MCKPVESLENLVLAGKVERHRARGHQRLTFYMVWESNWYSANPLRPTWLLLWNNENRQTSWLLPTSVTFLARHTEWMSWSIASHFGTIYSWNVCRSPKSPKIY